LKDEDMQAGYKDTKHYSNALAMSKNLIEKIKD
jgi:hypothetical protein